MASRDSLEVRKLSAKGAVQVSRDDTPVAIRVRKIGSESATSVTVTTATNIVFVGSTTTDTFAFATYTTVGALADAINSTGRWEAVVLDALRADATTASNFVTGVITAGSDANGVTVWDVLADTSVNKHMTATLSFRRNFDSIYKGHRVHLQEIVYNLDVNAASANAVRVYQRDASGNEVQLLGFASVDVTKTTINWAAGWGQISGVDGADLIVRVQDGTSVTDNTNNYVQATGVLE